MLKTNANVSMPRQLISEYVVEDLGLISVVDSLAFRKLIRYIIIVIS